MSTLVWKFGDVRITRIQESLGAYPAEEAFQGAMTSVVRQHRAWLAPHFVDDKDRLFVSIHALLVEANGTKIVVDTCIGNNAPPAFEAMIVANPTFLSDLAAADFDRPSVDYVICTHLHFDHVGWNTIRDGDRFVPTFPNARYIMTRLEFETWRQSLEIQSPEEAASFYGSYNTIQPLVDAGLLDLVEPGHHVTDGIWLEATPGHSPGHVAVHIDSRDERALITGDLTHHPVQWAEPDWSALSDSDQDQSASTRKRLLREYSDQNIAILGTHYPPPVAGRLITTQSGHRFVPLDVAIGIS
jgi:glyoxylase-like metal-dependent hydrolase (beta-lactamase superfamily II)